MRSLIGFLILLLPSGSLFAQSPDWNLVFTQPAVARSSMNMVFDSGRQVTVMFGGRNWPSNNTVLSDTYEYAPTAWNQVPTLHSPPARFW